MRTFLLVRHGQSVLNVAGVVNGDPALDRGLSEHGIEQAKQLAGQIANVAIDLVAVSPIPRALQTADDALGGRFVPREVDVDLGDVRIGDFEGGTLDDYRRETTTLVVCHEIPVRYAVNAAGGSDDLDRPLHDVANATPYLFDEPGLRRAVSRIAELAGTAKARA